MILRTDRCRFCNHEIEKVINFGKMPIANGFIETKDLQKEYFFNLEAAFCSNCSLFQLVEMQKNKIKILINGVKIKTENNSLIFTHN